MTEVAKTGRAASPMTIRAHAARHSAAAIQALAGVVNDEKAQAADRVSAAAVLLGIATPPKKGDKAISQQS